MIFKMRTRMILEEHYSRWSLKHKGFNKQIMKLLPQPKCDYNTGLPRYELDGTWCRYSGYNYQGNGLNLKWIRLRFKKITQLLWVCEHQQYQQTYAYNYFNGKIDSSKIDSLRDKIHSLLQ